MDELKQFEAIIDYSKRNGCMFRKLFEELIDDELEIIQYDKNVCPECLENEQNKDNTNFKEVKSYSKTSSTGNIKSHLPVKHKFLFTPTTGFT